MRVGRWFAGMGFAILSSCVLDKEIAVRLAFEEVAAAAHAGDGKRLRYLLDPGFVGDSSDSDLGVLAMVLPQKPEIKQVIFKDGRAEVLYRGRGFFGTSSGRMVFGRSGGRWVVVDIQ